MRVIIIERTIFDSLNNSDKHYLRNCHTVKMFLDCDGFIYIHCDYDGFSHGAKVEFLHENNIPYITKFLDEEKANFIKSKGIFVEMGFVSN